jgi:hypothetical protein
MQIVPDTRELMTERVRHGHVTRGRHSEKPWNLLYEYGSWLKRLSEPQHLEGKLPSRVRKACHLPDLTERLTGRTAVQKCKFARRNAQCSTKTIRVENSRVDLPDDLASSVPLKGRHTVGIQFHGANSLKSRPVHTYIQTARSREETDGRSLHLDTPLMGAPRPSHNMVAYREIARFARLP